MKDATVVNVAALKNRLSHYLREVRAGRSVLVRDRDRVIARIEPAGAGGLAAASDRERLADLERRGVLHRAQGRISADILARRPAVRGDAVRALLREREDGR